MTLLLGFKVIPIIYAIDSTVEIYENIFANKDNIINLLVGEAVHHDFEGFSIQQYSSYNLLPHILISNRTQTDGVREVPNVT